MSPEPDPFQLTHHFTTTLFHSGGKGGWTFAPLPVSIHLPITGNWGMTPVIATVDGRTWKTTVWKDSQSNTQLLPVPKKIRKSKAAGDEVNVELHLDRGRICAPNHPLE